MRFGNSRYWLFQVVGWGLFALIFLFVGFVFDKLDTNYYYRLFLFIGLGLLLTHFMRWVIRRANVLIKPIQEQIVNLVIITFIFGLLLGISETYSQDIFNLSLTNAKELIFKRLLDNSFHSFVYLFMWNCIYFIYHYIEKSRRQQLDALKLEALIKELELKTIKAHINPHFIFNSLNSIRALVDENPERARKAITELSNILRSSMQAEKSETVTLEKELYIVKDYLALENMRFEDRLRIEYKVDEETLNQPVPPMMLQTLVENAIKHGISRQINGGVVRVISEFKNNFHELAVQNTGRLNGKVNGEGFGISSTNDRLSLLYGNKAKFEIRQATPTLVEAKVSIPSETILR
ncbi:MAG: sensor histidine kinase [Bacteroidetes bacterium]|jgi:two-component system LytT family sensor kinase|nr:MAG: sensor histidine kinase [Bacteroidota bacterium]